MAANEPTNSNDQSRGFAGIASLLSNVDTTPPPVAEITTTNPTGTLSTASRPGAQEATQQLNVALQQPDNPPQRSGVGSSSRKWWIGIAAGIGLIWLLCQLNKNTSSPAPSNLPQIRNSTPSYSASPSQAKTPPGLDPSSDSGLMSNGDGAVYRVPSFREAELGAAHLAAESAKVEAKMMSSQVDTKRFWIDAEKRQLDQAQEHLDVLEREIEQQRPLVDSSNQYEVDSFNSMVNRFNTNRAQLRQRINDFNVDVGSYNDLVQQAHSKEQRANQLVNAYNSKLEEFGTRQ